jgi:hypothetical protein
MDLTLPIVVEEHGDVEIYSSVEDAEAALEAIDVRKGEYRFFDASGLVLKGEVEVSGSGPARLRHVFSARERVKLVVPDVESRDQEELASILRRYLLRVSARKDIDESHVRAFTLPELISATEQVLSE